MPEKPPEDTNTQERPQPADDPWYKPFWPHRPWWGKFYEDSVKNGMAAEGCGLGCLFLMVLAPLLIVVTDKNGEFKVQLVDLFCMTTLIAALCAYQIHFGPDLIWIDKIWIPLVIGFTTGTILAVVRLRPVWILAGTAAVPVMWMLIIIRHWIASAYQ